MLGPEARQRAVMLEGDFVRAGFSIQNRHTLTLTEEQAMEFFSDKVRPNFKFNRHSVHFFMVQCIG